MSPRWLSTLHTFILSHTWVVPMAIFLLIALGTLNAHSYFLHFDTSNIDVGAADLARACWGDPAATLGPVLLTTIPFLIFGTHPFSQTILVTLSDAVMVAALFRIIEQVIGSKRWALMASLWFISLPTILYYTRMHIGFPLAFFVLGIMLYGKKRWLLCGVSFALAVISHFNFSVPSAAFLIWGSLLAPSEKRIRAVLMIISGITLTFIAIETIDFLFTGIPFNWVRAVIGDATRLSDELIATDPWPITHLIHMMAFSNGWLQALLLLLTGIAYPLVRKPGVPLVDAIFASAWSVFVFYTVRVAMGNTFLTPRMFSAVYPLFVILAIFTAMRSVHRFRSMFPKIEVQRIALACAGLFVAFSLLSSLNEAVMSGQTGFEALDNTYRQAAEAGMPVRHFGNFHVAQFYGQRHGVETSINEFSLDIIAGDTQAVLIFEDGPMAFGSQRLRESGKFDLADYEIRTYPHVIMTRPASIEGYGMSPARLADLNAALHTEPRPRGSIEVWWPKNPGGEFTAHANAAQYIFYYDGSGCVIHRMYGEDHSLNYYHILAERTGEVWRAIRAGDFHHVLDLIKLSLSQ